MGPGWLTPVSWQPAGPAALRRLEVQGKSPGSCLPPGQIKDLACILRGITPSRPSSALTLASRSRSQCSLNFLCDVGGVGKLEGPWRLFSLIPAGAGARSSSADKKFPARVPPPRHPPDPLDAPPDSARSRTLAAPAGPRGHGPPHPPAPRLPRESPTQPPRAGTRTDSPAPSATLRTLRRALLEKALAREEGLGTRGRASRQVHSGGSSLPLGLTPAAHGSWLRDDQSRRPAFQSTGRGGRRDRAGRGWRGGPLRRAPRRQRGAKSSRVPRGALRVQPGEGGGVRRKPWAQKGEACPSRGSTLLLDIPRFVSPNPLSSPLL